MLAIWLCAIGPLAVIAARFTYMIVCLARFHLTAASAASRGSSPPLAAGAERFDPSAPSVSVQGGGMRYAWTVGALQALYEAFECDEASGALFVGTSSGLFPVLTIVNGTQPMVWLEACAHEDGFDGTHIRTDGHRSYCLWQSRGRRVPAPYG